MNRFRTSAVALISTIAFGALAVTPLSTANAAPPDKAPCAARQAHLDRATAKLDALTARFAAHHTKKVKRAKKAQVKRVAHATARLDKCMAAQPV